MSASVEYCLLECDIMECGKNLVRFLWDLLPPSTLKIEAAESHETSVNFYKITQHHIPEDSNLLFSSIFLTNS